MRASGLEFRGTEHGSSNSNFECSFECTKEGRGPSGYFKCSGETGPRARAAIPSDLKAPGQARAAISSALVAQDYARAAIRALWQHWGKTERAFRLLWRPHAPRWSQAAIPNDNTWARPSSHFERSGGTRAEQVRLWRTKALQAFLRKFRIIYIYR